MIAEPIVTVPAVPPKIAVLPAAHAAPVTLVLLDDQFNPEESHAAMPPRVVPLDVQ